MKTYIVQKPTHWFLNLIFMVAALFLLVNCSSSEPEVRYVNPPVSSNSSSSGGSAASSSSSGKAGNASSSSSTAAQPVKEGIGSFSMATMDTQAPSSILRTVSFEGGGGAPGCYGATGKSIVWGSDMYEIYPISRTQTKAERIDIASCGWTSTGNLPVIVTFPDGSTKSTTTTVQDYGDGLMALLQYELGVNPKPGNYKITFNGRSGSVSHNFRVVEPSAPRLYTPSGMVILKNFRALEPVLLFAYEEQSSAAGYTGKLVGYQEYMTDENGELYVDVSGSFDAFVALGHYSGEVTDFDIFKRVSTILD